MRVLVWLLMVSVTVSCTSVKPVNISDDRYFSNSIDVGDIVRISMKSGERFKFEVVAVSEDNIHGADIVIERRNVVQLDRVVPSKPKSLSAIVVGFFSIIIIAVASVMPIASS